MVSYGYYYFHTIMARKKNLVSYKSLPLTLGALLLMGFSFAFASGSLPDLTLTLASAASSITGKPTVLIGRSGGSPSGTIKGNESQSLANFDISVKNVTFWATMRTITVQTNVTQGVNAPVTLKDFYMKYSYCIPAGKSYGYGWKSGGCASMILQPSSVVKNEQGYEVSFYGPNMRIYPQQSYGALSVVATPVYPYTGASKKTTSTNAKIQVLLTQASATGDQCKKASRSYGYGYGGCSSSSANVNIQAGKGYTLTVQRPYGYGYNATLSTIPMPTPIPTSTPAGKVTLFKDCDYKGFSATFHAGTYRLADLIAHGVKNDDVSSIRIPSGYKVQLYKDDNFKGTEVTLTGDSSCFTGQQFNDVLSSMVITQLSSAANTL